MGRRCLSLFLLLVCLRQSVTSLDPVHMPSRQVASAGCTLLDATRASVYLLIEGDSETTATHKNVRIVNNSGCDIYLLTTGRQVTIRSGRLQVHPEDDIVEDAMIVPMFRANSEKHPWEFEVKWTKGDAYTLLNLRGGRSARFLIPREYLSGSRKIAVPFGYSWEPKWRDLLQHWVFSP